MVLEAISGFEVTVVSFELIDVVSFFGSKEYNFRFICSLIFVFCPIFAELFEDHFNLSLSPLLGRDEKHTKEREHACFFLNKFITRNSSLIQFHVYTHEKFRKVQAQFRGKVNCITRSTQSTLSFMIYKVSNSTFNKFVVTYNAISREVKLQCLLFKGDTHISRAAKTNLYWSQEARDLTIWYFARTTSVNLHHAFDNVMA
ncbi:hypothetical protein Ahy_A02g008901 [Arachis hypogaea]|uniref:Uncharacterized protein n=1 Tax=Arachis hypogaea TaxID=3818 RepID=A0A445EFN8_ARAHY|nr:hypothetical protein Ahy_A02g008901 [Arachis hypogaea]